MRSSSGPGMVSSTLRARPPRVSAPAAWPGGAAPGRAPAPRASLRAPRGPPQAQDRGAAAGPVPDQRLTRSASCCNCCSAAAHAHRRASALHGVGLGEVPRGEWRALGGAHEEDAGEVDGHVQVVVQEARVLLRVQQLQQRAGRVARVACARAHAREQKTKPCHTEGRQQQRAPPPGTCPTAPDGGLSMCLTCRLLLSPAHSLQSDCMPNSCSTATHSYTQQPLGSLPPPLSPLEQKPRTTAPLWRERGPRASLQGAGWHDRRTAAELVDLVDEHERVAGARQLQALNHLARHGAHVRAPVACGRPPPPHLLSFPSPTPTSQQKLDYSSSDVKVTHPAQPSDEPCGSQTECSCAVSEPACWRAARAQPGSHP
jgi:hypothetical protein